MSGKATLAEMTTLPIGKLRPNNWNPNKMPPRLYEALKANILAGGFVQPIIARPIPAEGEIEFEILDGEHRWRAMGEIGSLDISTIIVHDTDAQAKIRTIAMNRLRGEMAAAQTAQVLAGLDVDQSVITSLLGYGEKEFGDLMALAGDADKLADMAGADARGTVDEFIVISFAVPESAHLVIQQAFDRMMAAEECDKNVALERICADYLAGPHPA